MARKSRSSAAAAVALGALVTAGGAARAQPAPSSPAPPEAAPQKPAPSDELPQLPRSGGAEQAPLQVAVPPGPPPPPPPTAPEPPVAPTSPPRRDPLDDGAGPRMTSGRVLSRGLSDGWFGRFETEYFEAHGGATGFTRLSGILLGLEGWGGPNGGGGGVPSSVYGGFRLPFFQRALSPALFGSLGAGWDWVIYDRIEHVGGFGIFAPFGTGALGFDLRGIRLLVDARVQYRWEWGADDRAQLRLGASLGLSSEWWDK